MPDPADELSKDGGHLPPCECLSCQTGRPDYPCLLENGDE